MRVLTTAGLILLLAACEQSTMGTGGTATQVNIPFTPEISINEIMVAQIDHAAHFIWEAANPETAAADIQWLEAEHHAIQIISSRSALSMGGTGVNDAMWITQQSWREYVNQMNEGGVLALTSARARDREGLERAGNILMASCEGCHQQFKPSIPTEGYFRRH